jgi:hypothetical protein
MLEPSGTRFEVRENRCRQFWVQVSVVEAFRHTADIETAFRESGEQLAFFTHSDFNNGEYGY